MAETKKSTKTETKAAPKPEAKSDSKPAESASGASSEASSGGESGKSARESVGGAAVGHYGYFSNIKTPEYKSGWDDIWGKKTKTGTRKKAAAKPKAAARPAQEGAGELRFPRQGRCGHLADRMHGRTLNR